MPEVIPPSKVTPVLIIPSDEHLEIVDTRLAAHLLTIPHLGTLHRIIWRKSQKPLPLEAPTTIALFTTTPHRCSTLEKEKLPLSVLYRVPSLACWLPNDIYLSTTIAVNSPPMYLITFCILHILSSLSVGSLTNPGKVRHIFWKRLALYYLLLLLSRGVIRIF